MKKYVSPLETTCSQSRCIGGLNQRQTAVVQVAGEQSSASRTQNETGCRESNATWQDTDTNCPENRMEVSYRRGREMGEERRAHRSPDLEQHLAVLHQRPDRASSQHHVGPAKRGSAPRTGHTSIGTSVHSWRKRKYPVINLPPASILHFTCWLGIDRFDQVQPFSSLSLFNSSLT